MGLGLPRGERCLQGLRLCVLAVLSSGSPAPLFSLQNSRGGVCSRRSCCAALVAAKWRGMGTGLVPVRGHVVGIMARLRRWPLGNQVSIWPRSGSGFPIPALISGIARYYSYHNNGPVLGSHRACRGPVEGRVGGAGGCRGPQCSLLPRALPRGPPSSRHQEPLGTPRSDPSQGSLAVGSPAELEALSTVSWAVIWLIFSPQKVFE